MDIKRDKSNSSFEVKEDNDGDIKFGEARNFDICSPEDEAKSLTRSFKMKLNGRQKAVRAVEFIPAGRDRNAMVVGGREDKIAVLWDVESGVEKGIN